MASGRPDLQPVVVPVDVDADALIDRILVSGPPEPVDQEPLHVLLERGELPQRLRMMDPGPDVLARRVLLAILAHGRVHPGELLPVVREQVLEDVGVEARHPVHHHVVGRVLDAPSPSLPRVVVLHGQDGIAIERGEVALDELVRVSPLERFVPLQGPPLRLHEVVPGQDVVAGRVCDRVPGFKSEALVHYRGELLRPESRGVPDLDDPPLDVKRGRSSLWCEASSI